MNNNYIKREHRGLIFLSLSFILLTIISSYGSILSFDLPFPDIIITLILLFCYFVANSDKVIKIDKIVVLLLLRSLLFCLNVFILSVSVEYAVEELFICIVSILIFVGVGSFGGENDTRNILAIFSFIISLQLCLEFIINGMVNKGEIVAGIGASNYAAAFLLVSITYLIFCRGNILCNLVVVFDIIMLLMTLSFGAYIALFIVLCVYVVKHFDWGKSSTRKAALLILVALIAFLICFFNLSIGKPIFDKIKFKVMALLSGDLKEFGSSRIEVYSCSFNNFKKHYIFGPIINPVDIVYDSVYNFDNERTHNFILESLVRYGIVGTVINVAIIFQIIKKYLILKNTKYKKMANAVLITFIAALIHGLVEPNFFTKDFEFIIWLLLGSMFRLDNISAERSNSSFNVKKYKL